MDFSLLRRFVPSSITDKTFTGLWVIRLVSHDKQKLLTIREQLCPPPHPTDLYPYCKLINFIHVSVKFVLYNYNVCMIYAAFFLLFSFLYIILKRQIKVFVMSVAHLCSFLCCIFLLDRVPFYLDRMSKRYIYPQVTFVVDYIYVALSPYTVNTYTCTSINMSIVCWFFDFELTWIHIHVLVLICRYSVVYFSDNIC
jgi:hypothetical protein